MGIKSGFGKAGNMNSGKTSKPNKGGTKAGFGKAKSGPKAGKGYKSSGAYPTPGDNPFGKGA